MTMQQWLKTMSKCWKNINNKVITSELLESKSFRSLNSIQTYERDYPLNCVNEDLLLHFINHFPGQR
jgi:hypothetical protein